MGPAGGTWRRAAAPLMTGLLTGTSGGATRGLFHPPHPGHPPTSGAAPRAPPFPPSCRVAAPWPPAAAWAAGRGIGAQAPRCTRRRGDRAGGGGGAAAASGHRCDGRPPRFTRRRRAAVDQQWRDLVAAAGATAGPRTVETPALYTRANPRDTVRVPHMGVHRRPHRTWSAHETWSGAWSSARRADLTGTRTRPSASGRSVHATPDAPRGATIGG